MTADYLITAADAIYNLVGRRSKPKPKYLAIAARRSCDVLEELSEDKDFFDKIGRMSELRELYRDDFDAITGAKFGDIGHFRHFLRIERKVFMAGGMSPQVAKALVDQALTLIDLIRDGQYSAATLRPTIDLLKRKACNLANKLELANLSEQERIQGKVRLLRIARGIGGAAAITLNAATFAGTAGLSQQGAVVSTYFGSALIDAAVKGQQNDQEKLFEDQN